MFKKMSTTKTTVYIQILPFKTDDIFPGKKSRDCVVKLKVKPSQSTTPNFQFITKIKVK